MEAPMGIGRLQVDYATFNLPTPMTPPFRPRLYL
ncbi:uncharacterized protein G2W53_041025 [Senna tora]|uniref:Uncharacterized protein n=1 Tax=Senna tora TaxID=362788 RepID=A0A834SR87_9FABA|nr:uncharacterized protein G2W53_041022 [Senna tora]KAF7801914.1 uncharacterized protein G2W53_041025 [Senna tora]